MDMNKYLKIFVFVTMLLLLLISATVVFINYSSGNIQSILVAFIYIYLPQLNSISSGMEFIIHIMTIFSVIINFFGSIKKIWKWFILGITSILINDKSNKIHRSFALVENEVQLQKIIQNIPFIEASIYNRDMRSERIIWSKIRKKLDYSSVKHFNITDDKAVYFIKGETGIGKTTYLLWYLSTLLKNSNSNYTSIAILNPDLADIWALEIINLDPLNTILVLDALKRANETNDEFLERSTRLLMLAYGFVNNENQVIQPFKVITTLRNDEYDLVKKTKEFNKQYAYKRTQLLEISKSELNLPSIVNLFLNVYCVKCDTMSNSREQIINNLIESSGGNPFNIRHVIAQLKLNKQKLSNETINSYPNGMINLIWDTIAKSYFVKDDFTIPFLLLLLLRVSDGFSKSFISVVTDRLSSSDLKIDICNITELLMQNAMSPTKLDIGGVDSYLYNLDDHWKGCIRKACDKPESVLELYRYMPLDYKRIEDEHYEDLKSKVTKRIVDRLKYGFDEKANIILCVDLAKLGETQLKIATDIYCDNRNYDNRTIKELDFVKDSLYILWIKTAWKYRNTVGGDYKKIIQAYEMAFTKLNVRVDPKQLSSYAYFLQKKVLANYDYGTEEFGKWKDIIEKLHQDAISSQLSSIEIDSIGHQSFGLFYNSIGEYKKAEEQFQLSLRSESLHIPAIQAYAIFLGERGKNAIFCNNIEDTIDYYSKAREYFLKASDVMSSIRSAKNEINSKEKQYEIALLTAFAIFSIDSELARAKIARINGYTDEGKYNFSMANEKFLDVLSRYPKAEQCIIKYADLLMKHGPYTKRISPDSCYIEIAENMLRDYIDSREKTSCHANHKLAVLLYSYKSKYKPQNKLAYFQEAISLLEKNTEEFSGKQRSIAFHELAQLYMDQATWVGIENCNFSLYMNKAKKNIEKALNLPKNYVTIYHIIKVNCTLGKYLLHESVKEKESYPKYRDDISKLVRQFNIASHKLIYIFTEMGKDIIKEIPEEALVFFDEAMELCKRYNLEIGDIEEWHRMAEYKIKNKQKYNEW